MKNTRTNKTRSNIIILIAFAIATILLIGYSPNAEVAEQTQVTVEYRHDKIPAEEIEKTREWLNSQNLKAEAECIETGGIVEEIPEETNEDDEYHLLCKLVWAESTRKDKNEMVAIAATVLNRVEEDEFPDNITDVIFASGQFSPAKADGEIYWFPKANVEALVQDTDVTDDVRLAVDLALKGEDPTEVMINGGALFYFSDRYISDAERQKRENIGDSVKFGDTIFYREYVKK